MFSTVLFDLDGTLVDSEADIAASVNQVRGARGLAPASEAEVRAAIGDGVRALLDRTVPGWDDAALAQYLEHQESHCLDRTQLYPGAREALEAIAARAAVGVVSNKPTELCVRILRGLGAIEFVRVCIGGDTPAGRKPAPGPIVRALESLGTAPWDALVAGDSPPDLEAGRAAGCATVAVSWGYRPLEMLASLRPDFTAGSFAELASLAAPAAGPRSVFEAVGAERLTALTKSFYARIDRDPRLRALFPSDLAAPAENQALFLIQLFGGPSEYSRRRGAPRLRQRHANFRIDAAAAAAWLDDMDGALAEAAIPEPALGILRRYFRSTASFLVNAPAAAPRG